MGKKKVKNLGNKKSETSVTNYKNFIERSHYRPEGTVDNVNKMLSSSESILRGEDLTPKNEYKKKSIKYIISDTVKNNLFQAVIGGLLIAVICYVTLFIINTNIEVAVINQKIATIEQSIVSLDNDNINNNNVNKEDLQLQLDSIKKDIESGYKLNIIDINWRLTNIEKELDKQ